MKTLCADRITEIGRQGEDRWESIRIPCADLLF